uniref:RNase H type-1 domain-containing protein n=2 Tax=Trichogramma kaykai TaxID=54128 RepID=A0ABD2XG48_9HYME
MERNNNNYDAFMNLSHALEPDFKWWGENILSRVKNVDYTPYAKVIFSDASLTGWGAVCNGKKANGAWTSEEKNFHINLLELKAVFFGLKCFATKDKNCSILLRVDNTTAISYINKMGGTRFAHLHSAAREIWQFCEERNIWIFASYISSSNNFEADEESRRVEPETEYSLSDSSFEVIIKRWNRPEIDLFASRSNAKCNRYISWKRDPSSEAIDAFTLSWANLFFYAFPPFSIILKVLRKIKRDKAEGIVVVPDWPNQPWFPLFNSLLSSKPIVLKPNYNLLTSSNRNSHPMWNSLFLVAAKLSAKHC